MTDLVFVRFHCTCSEQQSVRFCTNCLLSIDCNVCVVFLAIQKSQLLVDSPCNEMHTDAFIQVRLSIDCLCMTPTHILLTVVPLML